MLYAKAHQRFCFTVFMVSLLSSSASSNCRENNVKHTKIHWMYQSNCRQPTSDHQKSILICDLWFALTIFFLLVEYLSLQKNVSSFSADTRNSHNGIFDNLVQMQTLKVDNCLSVIVCKLLSSFRRYKSHIPSPDICK